MAAYAALASLAHTTHPNKNQNNSPSITAEEKIRSIHEYVIFLQSFLEDFPEKAKRWEARMSDLAHETEDIIEQFMWQQSYHRRMKLSSVKFEGQLRNVAEKFCLMAGDMMDQRPAYSSLAFSSSSSSLSRAAPIGNGVVVGLESDLMIIKDRLCGLSSKLQVIPIVGMGGIGKTTLVRTVYDDSIITKHFHIRVWLTISQEYSARKSLLCLLHSMKLIDKEVARQEIDDSTMVEKVYKNLKCRRYLIVMDDVWSTKVWDDVRNMFPDDGNGSRIILTTRLADVAAYPDSNSPIHEMQFMNDSQSWDLLKQNIFGDGKCPPDLEDTGKEIARRCAGLPLAVVLVAGVLSAVNHSRARAFWGEIAREVILVDELEEILSLSYTYLPHYLRPCLLLIGGFLEDVNIRTSTLTRLWVAEGFVKHQNGSSKSLEEEAEEYLEDLVRRNLVIVTSRKSNGKIKRCSLHDMVRNLCIRKAHKEKYLHVMDVCDLPQGLMNERRISFSRSDIYKIWGPTSRTILCFQTQIFGSWLALLGSYKLLRVLHALDVDLKEIPSKVFELYHLRYLALMGSFSIPSTIANLVNLQTLIIHHAFGKLGEWCNNFVPIFLPLEIWRLPQLRHLFFHAPYMLPQPCEGLNLPLENLQTLLFVIDLVWNEKIIELMPNVKRLGLTYSFNEEHHLHYLKDLHQLEKLEVIGFRGSPRNLSFPSTLKKLTLVRGRSSWKDMAVVGSLPNLEILKLLNNACHGETWEMADEDFPRLKFLLIDESHLRQWITQSNPFPTLKRLVLRSCWYMKEMPEGLGEISTLELIEVDCCRNSLVESAMKIKEDQESYGNYALQVRVGHEVIQSCYKRMELSPSRPASTGNNAEVDLDCVLMGIKERLRTGIRTLQVIPIVGINGHYRFTLTRSVYCDPLILEHFEMRFWFTIPRNYKRSRPRKVILGLAHSMKLLEEKECGEKIDESEIATKIYQNLRGRRYLFVINEVWSREIWDGLRRLFPDDGNGSRIMLTTRKLHVASYPNYGNPDHEIMWFVDNNQS